MTEDTTQHAPRYRSAALSHRKPTRFRWSAEPAAMKALAQALDLVGISALTFEGEITPEGRDDFRLTAKLHAKVKQACVITLAPVPATIDEDVTRRFLSGWVEPDGEEVEIPEDETAGPLPEELDLFEVVEEALSLALPPYPRAEGASLGEAVYAAPGTDAMRDEDLRPFAGLAQLMQKSDTPERGEE